MSARQSKVASYYDTKVLDRKLEVGQLIYVYQPRIKRRKLPFKWSGPCTVMEERHPVYRVEVGSKKQWLIMDKWKPVYVGSRVEEPVKQVGKDEGVIEDLDTDDDD